MVTQEMFLMQNNQGNVYSTSPSGEKFQMSKKDDYDTEFERVKQLTTKTREENKEIVSSKKNPLVFVSQILGADDTFFIHELLHQGKNCSILLKVQSK
jgi:hypothetical protein